MQGFLTAQPGFVDKQYSLASPSLILERLWSLPPTDGSPPEQHSGRPRRIRGSVQKAGVTGLAVSLPARPVGTIPNVAWHEVPGKASSKEPSRRVRYDRAQLIRKVFFGRKFRHSNHRIGAHTCTDHTVPYGTALWGGAVPGTSCHWSLDIWRESRWAIYALMKVCPTVSNLSKAGPSGQCPEGATGLSPGFQPWESENKRFALKGREVSR
jgi:hypothetical protein